MALPVLNYDFLLCFLTFTTCPLLTWTFLIFISGIPVAESFTDKRHKRLVAYHQYKMITSPLIPLPPRWYALLSPKTKYWLFMERSMMPHTAGRPIKRRRLRSDIASGTIGGGGTDSGSSGAPSSSSPIVTHHRGSVAVTGGGTGNVFGSSPLI